uniref:Uncharacterized protein n=1 Tax=Ganoderma boninense TaxID=34458 RepID=A0A5K1JXB2_9APHY|nr:Uncharacterized protein [Ganoderma boninense]
MPPSQCVEHHGVKRMYYMSLAFAGDSHAADMQAHLDMERYLKESGLAYMILRERIYSESYPLYFGFWNATEREDEVLVPNDIPHWMLEEPHQQLNSRRRRDRRETGPRHRAHLV